MVPLVFVVDAVPERRGLVRNILELAGYRIEGFATTRIIDLAEQQCPAAMVIAANLADGSGLDLRKKMRAIPALAYTPVVVLADDATHPEFGDGEAGDQWLTNATLCDSILHAVQAAIARNLSLLAATDAANVDIVIDPSAMKISVLGKEVGTTTLEFKLIEYMARHHGKVFTRDALLDAVWGDLQFVTPRSVDACIRRIRQKIEPNSYSPTFLRTIRGVGYKLDARTEWKAESERCDCKICSAARARTRPDPGLRASSFRTLGRAASFN